MQEKKRKKSQGQVAALPQPFSFTIVVGHLLTSQRIVHFAKEVSVVCSLFVHHMFPNSNCRVHAQVLSSHGALPRLDLWREDPSASLCTGLLLPR